MTAIDNNEATTTDEATTDHQAATWWGRSSLITIFTILFLALGIVLCTIIGHVALPIFLERRQKLKEANQCPPPTCPYDDKKKRRGGWRKKRGDDLHTLPQTAEKLDECETEEVQLKRYNPHQAIADVQVF